jgi:P-type conjugative transfer protein TrbJ
MKKIIFIVSILLFFSGYKNAQAMFVFDAAALGQQIIHYIVMCNQYSTQSQQYARQIQQLQYEYQHLQNLNFKADLSGLDDMRQLMNSASGLSNDFARMQTQFEQQYPDFDGYRTQDSASYAQQALKWNKLNQQNALDVLKTATKLQESMYRDQDALRYLNDRSDAASGTKDLLQAMNQLLILQTKQLMQLEQLLTQTAKADAAYLAERSSRDAAEANRYQQENNTWNTTNNAVVNPNLGVLH